MAVLTSRDRHRSMLSQLTASRGPLCWGVLPADGPPRCATNRCSPPARGEVVRSARPATIRPDWTKGVRVDLSAIDLSGGMAPERDLVLAAAPEDPRCREGDN